MDEETFTDAQRYAYAGLVYLLTYRQMKNIKVLQNILLKQNTQENLAEPIETEMEEKLDEDKPRGWFNSGKNNKHELVKEYERWSLKYCDLIWKNLKLEDQEVEMFKQMPKDDITTIIDSLVKSISSDNFETDLEVKLFILQDLFLVSVSQGVYDARARVVLLGLATLFQVSQEQVTEIELSLQEIIYQHVADGQRKDSLNNDHTNIVKERRRKGKNRRYLYMGIAGVGGALAIGLTGGLLAAPLLGVGLASVLTSIGIGGTTAFLTGTGGLALITSIFGASGAGWSSYKMARRVKGITEFVVIPHKELDLEKPIDDLNRSTSQLLTVYESAVSDASSRESLDSTSKPESSSKSKTSSASIVEAYLSRFSPAPKKSWFGSKQSLKEEEKPEVKEDPSEVTKEVELPQPVLTLTVSGWTAKKDHFVTPWICLNEKNLNGEHFSLYWESNELIALAKAFETMIASEAVSFAASTVLRTTILAGIMAAVVWPAALLKVASIIDNPWNVALDRSSKTGIVLADLLCSLKQGHRPVTLIGSSLGARVIFFCLLELYYRKLKKDPKLEAVDYDVRSIVENVFLFGAPIQASKREWAKVRSCVAGRLCVGYSTSDWILAFLFRATGAITSIAGLSPVVFNQDNDLEIASNGEWNPSDFGIENFDLSEIISGHRDYKKSDKMKQVLEKCGVISIS